MTSRRSAGSPVQVIKLIPEQTTKGEKLRCLKLEGQVLRTIASDASEYPVAVIAIAGAARGGKSFILSYLLRYLQALEKGTNGDAGDWMDKSNPDISMHGKGFPFRNGVDRTTEGIWMWSRPFIIKRARSPEPMAVIVMDTEGCFDAFTNEREQSTLVGLALLASSCFIFNETHKIDENTLLTLSKFMQYGQLASQSFDRKAFQRLMFLVRDWNMPSTYDYGAAGGKVYITEKIMKTSHPGMSTESVKCRAMIGENFQDCDAYLMPYPGEEVLSNEFKGSYGEMKPQFRDHVEKFIVNLVEDVSPKMIGSATVNGNCYFDLLCKYVDMFNAKDLPDPTSIIQVTVLIALEAESNKLITQYQQAFEQKISQEVTPFIDESLLEKFHRSIKKKVMQNFNIRIGSELEKQAFREKAQQGMETSYRKFCQENTIKQEQYISACETETLDKFRDYIATHINSVAKIWDFQQFDEIVSKVEKKAEAKFLKAAQSSPEKFMKKQQHDFLVKLADIKSSNWKQLEQVRQVAVQQMEDVLEEIITDYSENLSIYIEDKILEESVMQKVNEKYQGVALKKFLKDVKNKFNDADFVDKYQEILQSRLEGKFQELASENQERKDELISQVLKDIGDAAELLKEELESLATEIQYPDFSPFVASFQEVYDVSLEQLEDLKLLDRRLYSQYKHQLKSTLESTLNEMKDSINQSATIKTQQSKELVLSKLGELKNQLLFLMKSNSGPYDDAELQGKVDSIQEKLLQSLTSSVKEKNPENWKEFVDQFTQSANKEAASIKRQNQDNKMRFEKMAREKVQALENEYKNKMTSHQPTFQTLSDLSIAHQSLMSELNQRLKKEILEKPSKLSIPWENLLQQQLETLFEKYKYDFLQKQQERKRVQENSIRDALELFDEKSRSFIKHNPLVQMRELDRRLEEFAEDISQDVERQVKSTFDSDSKQRKKILFDFNEKLDDLKLDIKQGTKKSQKNIKSNAETLVLQCVSFAEEKIQNIIQTATPNSLASLNDFDEVKSLTQASFESLWTFGDSELKTSTWDEIQESIVPLIKKAHQKLVTKFDKEKRELITLLDDVIQQQSKPIQDQLALGKIYSTTEFEKISSKLESDMIAKILDITKDKKPSDPEEIMTQFQGKVKAKAEELKQQNLGNIQTIRNQACAEVEAHLDNHKKSVKNNSDLTNLIEKAKKLASDIVQEKSLDGNTKEILQALTASAEIMRDAVEKELSSKQNQPALMEKACETYSKYMEENVVGKCKKREDLAQYHKLATEVAIKNCSDLFFLSPVTEKEIEKRLLKTLQIYDNQIALNMNQGKDIAIGIDLGTTTCCVAVYRNGKAEVLKNKLGNSLTPSYVYIPGDGKENVVGTAAKDQAHLNPEKTVFDSKRLIGREFNDPYVQQDRKTWPFEVRANKSGRPEIVVNDKPYSPEDISAFLLRQMKNTAYENLGYEVKKAVITVPANFDDRQRDATRQAAQIAGLDVLQIINEPTAAAMAYVSKWKDVEKNILVFDFGGGTFDVTILKASGADLQVLTTLGDTHLGGEDFDNNMLEICTKRFEAEHSVKLLEINPSLAAHEEQAVKRRMRRLRERCEVTKKHLTEATSAAVDAASIYGETDLHLIIERDEFEKVNQHLFEKAISKVQEAIGKAKLSKEQINEVLMVGGSSRIPRVQEMLRDFLGQQKLIVNQEVDIQEAVALGASIQACILNGGTTTMSLIKDVQPFSLGINTVTGNMSVIIPKDSPIPFEKMQSYTTTEDDQEEVNIEIFSGEDTVAVNNKSLGSFILGGIPPGLARSQEINVKMQIDASGILNVTAVCVGSGVSKNLVIQENRGRLSEEEVKEKQKALELPPPIFTKVLNHVKNIFSG